MALIWHNGRRGESLVSKSVHMAVSASLSSKLISWMERQKGWRLWVIFTLVSVAGVELIVSAMSWLLKGEITPDYLLTGLVAAGCVAPVSLAVLTGLLEEIGRSQEHMLELEGLRAQKNLQLSLDAARMVFWELDLTRNTLTFDDSRLHWLGLVPSAALHTLEGWLAIVHPDDKAAMVANIGKRSESHEDTGQEYRLCMPDGHLVWHRTVGRVAQQDESGKVTLLAGGTVNITKRKLAEGEGMAARQKLHDTLEALPDLLFEVDSDGRFLDYHAPRSDMLAAAPDAFLGKMLVDVLPPDVADVCLHALAEAKTQGHSTGAQYQLSLPGGLRWFELSISGRSATGLAGRYIVLARDITDRKQVELAQCASEERASRLATMLRLVSDNVPDMIWAKDLDKRYLFANKAMCEQLLGTSTTDEPVGRDDMFFALRARSSHPDNPHWHTFGERCQDTDDLTLHNGVPSQFEESGFVQGQFVSLDVHKAPLLDDHGQLIGVLGSARDVTAQKAAQDKLVLASLVLDNSSEAMLATDAQNCIVEINPAFTTLTGYSRDEVIGKDPAFLRSGRQSEDFYKSMWHELATKGHWQGELWNKRKDGEIYAEWLTVNTIYHDDGSVNRRVALFSDVTAKKQAEELIWKQANFDALTGLPNRRMFHDRLAQDLIKAHRSGLKVAVFFLDLDHFKEVNDTLGHELGDVLLVETARRIAACVRASDTVARLGGDEFTVILSELDDSARVETIASNIIQSLARVFELDGHLAHVTASIGITLCPDDATSADVLMQNADQAMYEAKRTGRNRFSFFTRAMQARVQDHFDLMEDLRKAMVNGQLKLFFQPIVALDTGHLHKVEALLRWFHPQRGMVSPGEFIPLAEDCGLIHQVGDWVFSQAVRQAQRWSSLMGKNFKIALNMSPLQLLQANVHHIRWREQLASSGISGQNFVIEISEDMLHETSSAVTTQLKEFRDAGTQVAVDHFGAGCSSFFELKKRQIAYFKIEKATIQNLTSGEEGLALAQAVVVMAHQLGLKVIAEGVETEQQHALLLAMGCDFAQGFLYSKPVAAAEVEALFARDSQLNLPI